MERAGDRSVDGPGTITALKAHSEDLNTAPVHIQQKMVLDYSAVESLWGPVVGMVYDSYL